MELNVSQSPPEALWQPSHALYVPSMRRLAVIEVADTNDQQIRVTSVGSGKNFDTAAGAYQEVASPNDYVDILEQSGFPERSFDFIRTDNRYVSEQSGGLADLNRIPVLNKVTEVVGDWVGSFSALALRRGKAGELKDSIRTERYTKRT